MRRMPSRIDSSSDAEKLSRIELRPRPSRNAASPGTNATLSRSARASRSVVSMKSGSVAQMNSPPPGRVHSAWRREVLGERVEHRVAAGAVDVGQRVDVVAPVAALEVGLHHQLRERRRAQVGALLAEVDLLEHRRRRRDPAEPDARREDLRERAQVHHVDAAVERVQRRQLVALVAQQPVRVVLEHEQLALVGDLDQPPPAAQRHRHAGRVLEGRHRVDELRPPALALEPVERLLEQVDPHARRVHLDLDDVGLVGEKTGTAPG